MSTGGNWLGRALPSTAVAVLTTIFWKIGIQDVDPDLATLIRTVVVLVALTLVIAYVGMWSAPLRLPSRTLHLLGLSGLATGASWLCYYRVLQTGDASRVAPVDKLILVLFVIIAAAIFSDPSSLRDSSRIALVAGGVPLLAVKR